MHATNVGIARREADAISPAWWAIVSRFLLHGLILSTWASRIPAMQGLLHLNNATLGLCLLGTATGSVVSIPLASRLIGRYGSRRVTAGSTVALSLALLPLALAFNAWTLFAGLVLLGAAAGANDVSINAQGVAMENALGTPTMSRLHAMFSVGGMVGASIGALLAAHAVEARTHFAAASLLFIALALATGPFLLEANDEHKKREKPAGLRALPTVVFTLATIAFCMFLSEGAMADWGAVYLKQVLQTNQGLAATGYAVFSTGMAVFRLLGDAIHVRLGAVKTLRTGAIAAMAGLGTMLLAHSSTLALMGLAVIGAGFSVIVPLVFAAGGRASWKAPSAGIALISGTGYIGFLVGPPLIGFIAQVTSLRAALGLLIVLSGAAAVLAPAVGRGGRAAGFANGENAVE